MTIVQRDGSTWTARFRNAGVQRLETLGKTEEDAECKLRELLVQLDQGTFVAKSERAGQRFATHQVPRWSLPELFNAYVSDVRKSTGEQTAKTYGDRLAHVVAFAEQPEIKRRWRLAAQVDRAFIVDLKAFLHQREVSRNGRPGGKLKRMSQNMIRLALETLRMALRWASRPDVRNLPSHFVQPVSDELLPVKPQKDPTRRSPLPMEVRIQMIHSMDAWQLLHVSPLTVLPVRFEDVAGAVVTDFDFERGIWRIGDRFGGDDFTKAHQSYELPLPPVLNRLLRMTAGGRSNGPMFRSRRIWTGKRIPTRTFLSLEELEAQQHDDLRAAGDAVQTANDRKEVLRRSIRIAGAAGQDEIAKELRRLMKSVGVVGIAPYMNKHAVTSDMRAARLNEEQILYLTGHAVSRANTNNQYSGIDHLDGMNQYSTHIQRLLDAIARRASELGLQFEA